MERLAVHDISLVCPACRAAVEAADSAGAGAFTCSGCGRTYPIIEGIPDFRLKPDRFISIEADRVKGLRALGLAKGDSFSDALRAYWSITPELDTALAEPHMRRQLAEVEAGKTLWREVDCRAKPQGVLLDLGCAAGGNLVAASDRFSFAVGVDVGFRWLLLTARRLADDGVAIPLICANAEHLPFAEGTFDFVLNNDVLEHVVDPHDVVDESARVLRPGGETYIATNNRFSIAPEPHVRLIAVGWLPRSLQPVYARLRRGHRYDKVRLMSAGELARAGRRGFGQVSSLSPAPVPSAHLSGGMQSLARAYDRIRAIPLGRALLTPVAPRVQIVCHRLRSRKSGDS